jgi:hypothetical protein
MWTNAHNTEKKFHKNFGGLDIVRMFAGVVRWLALLQSASSPQGFEEPGKARATLLSGFPFFGHPGFMEEGHAQPFRQP